MTGAILWKEYRQQRAAWVAIVVLNVLLVVIMAQTMGQGSGLQAFEDAKTRTTLVLIGFILVMAFGLISGALLFAGEKEDGTLPYLDRLIGIRKPLWTRKSLAGFLLTLSISVVIGNLNYGLGFGPPQMMLAFNALDALVWGIIGGVLCRTSLKAVWLGIVFLAATWTLAFVPIPWWALLVAKGLLCVVGLDGSALIFCSEDRMKWPVSKIAFGNRRTVFGDERDALIWLAFRQGQWVLAIGLIGALIVGIMPLGHPEITWPLGTLALGLLCGLAVFTPEQNGGSGFWGARRFPTGRVWTIKVGFWFGAAALFTSLAWLLATLVVPLYRGEIQYMSYMGSPVYWISQWLGWLVTSPTSLALFIGIWPVYGFCFGLFFGQVALRPVVGAFLAVSISIMALALFVPSMLIGGVQIWWTLTIPAVLLVTSLLAMRPWLSWRFITAKPLLGMIGAAAVMILCVTGFLWYRAGEVPDVGEPFDIEKFREELKAAPKEGGKLMVQAAVSMDFWMEINVDATGRDFSDATLDKAFREDWVKLAYEAARAPVGFVFATTASPHGDQIESTRLRRTIHLFISRAEQIQNTGDFHAALDHLETALGLTRQMKSYVPGELYRDGCGVEMSALFWFHRWLENVGPDRKLLEAGLKVLQHHEANMPPAVNSVKLDYLMQLDSPVKPKGQLRRKLRAIESSLLVPWEQQRLRRGQQAIALGKVWAIQKPPWEFEAWKKEHLKEPAKGRRRFPTLNAVSVGLPPIHGPGSVRSAPQWGDYIEPMTGAVISWDVLFPQLLGSNENLQRLRATQLLTAVLMYQSDHDQPPAKLEDIMPNYMTALPVNLANGGDFGYLVSKGGMFQHPDKNPVRTVALLPGQAVIWVENNPFEIDGSFLLLPVPVWKQ